MAAKRAVQKVFLNGFFIFQSFTYVNRVTNGAGMQVKKATGVPAALYR
jgi:hypothetical protein